MNENPLVPDNNPTRGVSLDFDGWLADRDRRIELHTVDGIPDYAFDLDWKIRRRLDAVPALRVFVQALLAGQSALRRAILEQDGVAVGPRQLPKYHAMAMACAERLGIPVPQVYIVNDHHTNAYTLALGESDPIVVLHSGLLTAMEDDEVKAVMGHECGHIHNQHSVYNVLWEMLANKALFQVVTKTLSWLGPPGWIAALLLQALSGGVKLLFQRWHRCAEITCDRAGLICADDMESAIRVDGKLALGHVGHVDGFDIDVFAEQMKIREQSWIAWLRELGRSHPPPALRAKAATLFLESDVLRTWRPELLAQGPGRPKAEIDAEVAKFIL
ncbi:MAG: M48 family metallopeptidase [Myxococcota bacterium]